MGIITAEDYQSISKCPKTFLSYPASRNNMSSHSKKQKAEINKQAQEQFKDKEFEDETQVPDEIIVNGQVVANPHKEQQLKQAKEKEKSGEGFNPQVNPEDARTFTRGQVDNKSVDGLTVKVEPEEKDKAEKAEEKESTGTSQSSSQQTTRVNQQTQQVKKDTDKDKDRKY